MAVETGAVWAIDIGNDSLKAMYLSTEHGYVEVLGFDNIRHSKILSGTNISDAERAEIIAISLRELVNKYDLSMEEVAVSVPSQNSFTRFVKLPPVEAKRIPEMVKFEAAQQIPFGINDVQWDWQMMSAPDSPEIKVGIFAIQNSVANAAIEPLTSEDIDVNYVQIAPMALYNYLLYDRPELVTSDREATVIVNIGASNTDLVVCTKSGVWQRCILIGGNAFTQAVANTFKLNFEKAEKLKRTAPMSKYARQIFQAMKPIFSDLTSEVQRSLGFYNSANPNTKIVKIIAMGGGTKMRGLLKYMQQTLQIPVERPDSFKRISIGANVSQAKFHENICDLGIVYGLALQGLGLATIENNLLPRNIARSREWVSKGKYFIAAACLLLIVSFLSLGRTALDKMEYAKAGKLRSRTSQILSEAEAAATQLENVGNMSAEFEMAINTQFQHFAKHKLIPQLYQTIMSVLPNSKNTPDQAELFEAFSRGDVETIKKTPRKQRKQLFITGISAYFTNDLALAAFDQAVLVQRSFNTTIGSVEASDYDFLQSRKDVGNAELVDEKKIEGSFSYEEEVAVITDPGFVVTITGYSPYGKNSLELGSIINPSGVENEKSKWGLFNRLGHLDDFYTDGNCPFELYQKGQNSIEISELNVSEVMPGGIGVGDIKYRTSPPKANDAGQQVLVDPMTKEIISALITYDESGKIRFSNNKIVYEVNDHWFVLKLKFLLRNNTGVGDTASSI